ncbi:hypothetical protein MNBD_NITROSPINAE05-227 [hydrothermal vent metagenome]|uniref:Uncharacterized protein n=1 Tax=hydrothermal vent metagenome TaxID=652676 RepID=A0A3B1D008_9ZZZZ
MIIQDNLLLNRAEPNGLGGMQFVYKVNGYGVTAISRPQEEISNIHWEVDIIKFLALTPLQYEVCHTTDLAKKTLKFYNDKALNEFLGKAFDYFQELELLEKMLPKNDKS